MKKSAILLFVILALSLVAFLPSQVKATTYTYTIIGPYYEAGAVAPKYVSGGIVNSNGTVQYWNVSGVGGTAQTKVLGTYATPALYIAWNVTTVANATKRYYFFLSSATSDTVNIMIPLATFPYFNYQFIVADFYGMTNPYLQTTTTVNGTTWIVERQPLLASPTSFIMQQYQVYGLQFVCTQGTYSQSFTAENTFSNSLAVLAGAFPTSPYGNELYAYAERLNGSNIQIQYADPSNSTIWLYIEIYHSIGSYQITDYTLNTTGYSYNQLWVMGNSLLDYTVLVQAYVYGQEYDYSFSCPGPTTGTNPWIGLLDSLGSWPPGLEPSQIIATAIILAFLCIGSYASVDVGCVLAWLATGILVVLGWYTIAIPNFVFAGFVTFLVIFAHAKKTEREL